MFIQTENEYGEIIAYERSMSSTSVNQLCEGLCSVANLQRIEKGERSCEKIFADALFQRLGVSTDKFSYLLNAQEYHLIMLRENIVMLVDENQKEEAERYIEEYRKLTKEKHVLHLQFCMLATVILKWKNGENAKKIQCNILEAWRLTKKGKRIPKLKGQHLSFFEIALVMLYVRLWEDCEEVEHAIEGYEELLLYLEKHLPVQDRVKWYPQISYRLIQLLMKKERRNKALKITTKALKLLRNQASFHYLIELLEQYTKLLKDKYFFKTERIPLDLKKQLADIDLIRESLCWLYEEYQIKHIEWTWNLSFGMSEIYLCQDIIHGRRLGMGMTQEELADGICDPVTISRIEHGKNFPKRKVLVQLLQKLKWSGENCTLTAQIGRPEFHQITSQISMLTHTGKLAEAEILLEDLEQKVQKKNIFAEQYFLNSSGLVKYGLAKMNSQTCFMLQNQAFQLTMPNNLSYEKLKQWHFSRGEVMCINAMVYPCEEVGKEKEILELLLLVQKFYERQPFQLRYYRAGYELSLRNIGNLLGNMGKYEEAIKAADTCIKLALGLGKIGNVIAALYDKGWDMERLWKTHLYTKKESLAYIKASYALNLFLRKDNQCKFIINHIKEFYDEDI